MRRGVVMCAEGMMPLISHQAAFHFPVHRHGVHRAALLVLTKGLQQIGLAQKNGLSSSPSRASGSSNGYKFRHRVSKKAMICGIWRID
jgi:hypothetical protein